MRVDIDGLFQTLEDSLDLFLGLYLEDHQLVVSLGLEELVEVVTDASETVVGHLDLNRQRYADQVSVGIQATPHQVIEPFSAATSREHLKPEALTFFSQSRLDGPVLVGAQPNLALPLRRITFVLLSGLGLLPLDSLVLHKAQPLDQPWD